MELQGHGDPLGGGGTTRTAAAAKEATRVRGSDSKTTAPDGDGGEHGIGGGIRKTIGSLGQPEDDWSNEATAAEGEEEERRRHATWIERLHGGGKSRKEGWGREKTHLGWREHHRRWRLERGGAAGLGEERGDDVATGSRG